MKKPIPTPEQLKDAMQAALDDVRDFTTTPNWEPLHRNTPEEWHDGFMWMYASLDDETGNVIEHYKHGITRRYLHIDQDNNFYFYYRGKHNPTTRQAAIAHIYEDIYRMNCTPATPYNPAYICARNKALKDAGYKVIG